MPALLLKWLQLPAPQRQRNFLGDPRMLDISMALCHAATCQVCAAAALQARFAGKAVIIGLPVPMDSLLPLGRRPT